MRTLVGSISYKDLYDSLKLKSKMFTESPHKLHTTKRFTRVLVGSISNKDLQESSKTQKKINIYESSLRLNHN